MTFDLLCSEYGWTKEYILDCLTPAQIEVLGDAIARRRRTELAREAGLIRIAVWGDQRQFDELRRELLDDDPRETAQALAAMGIALRKRRDGSRDDDGQPAG